MWGHLKAEDFVNLMEGGAISADQRTHMDSCASCRETWKSMESLHSGISSPETEIPEPEWTEFRSSVRDQLLSRSVQRETAIRRWTGWTIRPAAAWALSLVMAAGLTTATVIWKMEQSAKRSPAPLTEPLAAPAQEIIETGSGRTLFDDIVTLGEEEQERFALMLLSNSQ
jgi:hypothetical protein